MADRLLTKDEVAEMLGVPANAVAVAARNKRLGYVRVGNTYRFRAADVDAWVESMRVTPKPQGGAAFRVTPLAAARRARAVAR